VNFDSFTWYLSRGTGMAAVVLLTLTVALGLALSLKLSSPRWPRLVTNEVHRSLTSLALWMIGLHVVTLLADSVSGFTLTSALVPFAGDFRPVATALGILALYLVVAVWATTKVRDRIGYARWRKLHMLAFVAYGTTILHGILSGTDTGDLWTTGIYLASVVLVGGLLAARISASAARRGNAGAPPPPAPRGPLGPEPRAEALPRIARRPEAAGLPPLPGHAPGTGIRHT
jgi:methionine sulfoxide reductase heme-binding subunit